MVRAHSVQESHYDGVLDKPLLFVYEVTYLRNLKYNLSQR